MSDLAQETRAPSHSAPAPVATPAITAAAPSVTPAATGAGNGDVRSLSSVFSGLSEPKNSYGLSGDQRSGGSFPSWQSQNWTSLGGFGVGNRLGDTPQIDPKKPDEAAKVKNATMGAPSIGNVDLSKIKPESSNNGGNGFYHDSRFGTFSQVKGPNATYNKDGKAIDLYSGNAVAGVSEQVGLRGTAKHTGEYGTATASGDLFALAEAGAEAKGSIGTNGIQGAANTSARAGVGVKGDADLSSNALNIDGVDPLYAKLGAHADGFAGARVGADRSGSGGPELQRARRPGHMLPADFYLRQDVFELDLDVLQRLELFDPECADQRRRTPLPHRVGAARA